jgi:hypothetical protein
MRTKRADPGTFVGALALSALAACSDPATGSVATCGSASTREGAANASETSGAPKGLASAPSARVSAAPISSASPSDAVTAKTCGGADDAFKHTPLSHFVGVTLGPLAKPEPLGGDCPAATCYVNGHGAGTWYTADVHVGLKPKVESDRCAALAIAALEDALRRCALAEGTVAGAPVWLGTGSFVVEVAEDGKTTVSNVELPKGLGAAVATCIKDSLPTEQLFGADGPTSSLAVLVHFESGQQVIAE